MKLPSRFHCCARFAFISNLMDANVQQMMCGMVLVRSFVKEFYNCTKMAIAFMQSPQIHHLRATRIANIVTIRAQFIFSTRSILICGLRQARSRCTQAVCGVCRYKACVIKSAITTCRLPTTDTININASRVRVLWPQNWPICPDRISCLHVVQRSTLIFKF